MPSELYPRVSALVVSNGRMADLRLCLEALIATGYPELEILVLDNASRDGSADVATSFPNVRVLRSTENLGFGDANSRALAASSGRYVALVHDDAVVEPGWIRELVAFLDAHPSAAAAGGKAYFWSDEHPVGDRRNPYYSYGTIDVTTCRTRAFTNTPDEPREVATLSDCAVMIRRDAIDAVGPPFLEPTFSTHYEETDFFARALGKGHSLWYTGAPAVWHRVGGTNASRPYAHHFQIERNRLLFAYRNLAEPALAALLAEARNTIAGEIVRHPVRFLEGRHDADRARRDAYLWILRNRRPLRASCDNADGRYEQAVARVEARAAYYGHERPEVAALVPANARRVVDVGCGAGALGRALKAARPGVEVRGIEIVAEQAARARKVLDDVAVAGAEAPLPAAWPRPDCVVLADVLEHLVDPLTVLRTVRAALAPGGSIVVSLPNVAHRSVVLELLRGRWEYEDAGVLDRTHLRFFTGNTALELIEGAGYRVTRVERVIDLPGDTRLQRVAREYARHVSMDDGAGPARLVADLATVQFLIVAEAEPEP